MTGPTPVPDGATITLRYPVVHEGQTISTLTMRRPLARDSRDAQRGGGSPADAEMRLFANLCEVAPGVLEEMDLGDYLKLQKQFEVFLGG